MNSNKTLLVFTTANQIKYTTKCYESFAYHKPDYIDILVVDDASNDGTQEYVRQQNIRIIDKEKPLGLTDSWNQAYGVFKRENYKNLILSNNDLLIPPGAVESVIDGLNEYAVVGALSSKKGVHHQPLQAVDHYFDIQDYNPDDPNLYLKISEHIRSLPKPKNYEELSHLNGFFFGFTRDVIKYEIEGELLFDPQYINVRNEDYLCNTVKEKKAVSLNSFIYHFKGVSFKDFHLDGGYRLERNLTWSEAQQLRKGGWRLKFYKIIRDIRHAFKIGPGS